MSDFELEATRVLAALRDYGGLIKHLGMTFEVEGEAIRFTMPIEQRHLGGPGVAHGGAVMAFMDTALGGYALVQAIRRGQATSTVEMKVNFLQPARLGATLTAEATLQSAGRSLLVVSGAAIDLATGTRVAFAVGTFNLYEADFAAALKSAP